MYACEQVGRALWLRGVEETEIRDDRILVCSIAPACIARIGGIFVSWQYCRELLFLLLDAPGILSCAGGGAKGLLGAYWASALRHPKHMERRGRVGVRQHPCAVDGVEGKRSTEVHLHHK
eukprot:scaffold75458_cov45-Prasinocladus_malaysianus.AAC.1